MQPGLTHLSFIKQKQLSQVTKVKKKNKQTKRLKINLPFKEAIKVIAKPKPSQK